MEFWRLFFDYYHFSDCAFFAHWIFFYGYWHDDVFSERFVYGLFALCLLRFFHRKVNLHGKRSRVYLFAGFSALLCTALVYLYNNLLHYLDWFNTCIYQAEKVSDIAPYWAFLRYDLTYAVGWGWARYPTVFLIVLFLCLVDVFLRSEKVRQFWSRFGDSSTDDFPDQLIDEKEKSVKSSRSVGFVQIEEYRERYREDTENLLLLLRLGTDQSASECLKAIENDTAEHNGKMFVAVQNDRVVGFIAGILGQSDDGTLIGKTIKFIVLKDDENQSISQALLARLEDYYQEINCALADIELQMPNLNSLHFYLKSGYDIQFLRLLKWISQKETQQESVESKDETEELPQVEDTETGEPSQTEDTEAEESTETAEEK